MKNHTYKLWYAAAAIGTIGIFLQWNWVDPFFAPFCIAMGQYTRLRLGLSESWFERKFSSGKIEAAVVGSILLLMAGISSWIAYEKYIGGPRAERAAIEEFKNTWEVVDGKFRRKDQN